MEQAIISGIAFNRDEAKISVMGVEDRPGIAYSILGPDRRRQHRRRHDRAEHRRVGAHRLLVHGQPERVPEGARRPGARARQAFKAREIIGDNRICKVSVVGIGMRSHVGIASKMFKALADEGINIQMISTSEIKISVVIDEKYLELAVRVLHRAFELDRSAEASVTAGFSGIFAAIRLTRQRRRAATIAGFPETWPSGRRHSPAKGAYGPKPVSRVRIPASPPHLQAPYGFPAILAVNPSSNPSICATLAAAACLAFLRRLYVLGKARYPTAPLTAAISCAADIFAYLPLNGLLKVQSATP